MRAAWRELTLAIVLVAMPALASNPELDRAAELYATLKLPAAARALSDALAIEGNDRATLLRILELSAVVAALQGQGPKASELFKRLLIIDPGHQLDREYAPKVMTFYYEAAEAVAKTGTLKLVADAPALRDGKVVGLSVALSSDPLGDVKLARIYVASGAEPEVFERAFVGGRAELQLEAAPAQVSWWAEVLDAREAVLATLGDRAAPLTAAAPSAPPLVFAPVAAGPKYRPLVWAGFAVGVAGVATGVIFAVLAKGAQSQIDNAARDPDGNIVGITQKQASDLAATVRLDATLAGVFLFTGVAAAVTGLVLWWLDAPVAPGAGGFIAGRF